MKLFISISLVLGLLMASLGIWLLTTDSARKDAERIAALPRGTPGGLSTVANDTVVLVEGRLVPRVTVGPQGFVAYHRESFRRTEDSGPGKGREAWTRVETMTPEIAIEGGGETVTVANRNYRLEAWPHTWRSDPVPRNLTLLPSTERILGFKAGDIITIEGTVRRASGSSGAPRLDAVAVRGGDAVAYVQAARDGIGVFRVVGYLFTGLGLLFVGAGVLGLRWARRPQVPLPPSEDD